MKAQVKEIATLIIDIKPISRTDCLCIAWAMMLCLKWRLNVVMVKRLVGDGGVSKFSSNRAEENGAMWLVVRHSLRTIQPPPLPGGVT